MKTHESKTEYTRLDLDVLPHCILKDLAPKPNSILVTLPSKPLSNTATTHVHIHRDPPSQDSSFRRVELKTDDNAAVVLSCHNNTQREKVLEELDFCTVNRPTEFGQLMKVERLRTNHVSQRLVWCLHVTPDSTGTSIRGSVRAFFRESGCVPLSEIIEEVNGYITSRKLMISHNESPYWLRKLTLTATGQKDRSVDAVLAVPGQRCTLCRQGSQSHDLPMIGTEFELPNFVAYLADLESEERLRSETGHHVVAAFDEHINRSFPHMTYDQRVLALRQLDRGILPSVLPTQHLKEYKFLLAEGLDAVKLADEGIVARTLAAYHGGYDDEIAGIHWDGLPGARGSDLTSSNVAQAGPSGMAEARDFLSRFGEEPEGKAALEGLCSIHSR